MKLLRILFLISLIAVGPLSIAKDFNCGNSASEKLNSLNFTITKDNILLAIQTEKSQKFSSLTRPKDKRRGCCSWHSGVCGCSNGRAVCCDNTLSPSCGCD